MLLLQTPFPFTQSTVDAENFWPLDEKNIGAKTSAQ